MSSKIATVEPSEFVSEQVILFHFPRWYLTLIRKVKRGIRWHKPSYGINYCSLQYSNVKQKDSSILRYIGGLVQGERNSIANALELRFSCTNPST